MTDQPDPAKAERIARIVAQAEREAMQCGKCGQRHLPATPCAARPVPEKPKVIREGDPVQKWQELAQRAVETPMEPHPTGRKCPGCDQEIVSVKNFLGVWFDVIGPTREYLDEHQAQCCKPITRIEEPVELVRPERPRRDLE